MHDTKNIRNISVIAHVDHGKTTLTDSLVQAAGIIPEKNAGTARYTDTRADEQERCITIKSTAISLLSKQNREVIRDGKITRLNNEVLINLIDSPGHIDFTSEVTAALRSTDGAIIVVDATKGCQSQTITVTKQAIRENIHFTVFINKIDTVFNSHGLTPGDYQKNEDVYHILLNICQDINNIIEENLKVEKPGYNKENTFVDMRKLNVAFGSGKQCWGLTIEKAQEFLNRNKKPADDASDEVKLAYAAKQEKARKYLWGDYFLDVRNPTKYVTSIPEKDKEYYARGFVYTIANVLLKIKQMCTDQAYDQLKNLIPDKDFIFPSDPKELERAVLKKLFPLEQLLMNMVVDNLPSPVDAQKYRAEELVASADDFPLASEDFDDKDEPAALKLEKAITQRDSTLAKTKQAIHNCDPQGPLIVYCTKKTPHGDLKNPTIYTLGRIVSGTLQSGTKVLAMGQHFKPTEPIRKDHIGNVANVMIMIGKIVEPVRKMPCGNIVGIAGIDQALPGPGTLTDYLPDQQYTPIYPLVSMKYVSVAIVSQRVVPKETKDLHTLAKAASLLSKLDLTCKVVTEDTGVTVYGVGPLHKEILVQDMCQMFGKPYTLENTIINCAETVTHSEPPSSMAKSANKHNRFTGYARVLGDELTDFVDDVTNPSGFTMLDLKARFTLGWGLDNTKFNQDNLKRVYHIGSGNCLYNGVTGSTSMDDMKPFIIDGFYRAIEAGPMCGERIRGVQYCLTDVVCHADAIHRGQNQVAPATRNLFLGSILASAPTVVEPIFDVILEGPMESFSGIQKLMNQMHAKMTSITPIDRNVEAIFQLSMFKSMTIQPKVMTATSGKFSTRLQFNGYEPIPGDFTDPESELSVRIKDKRIENRLDGDMKGISHYLDRL